MLGKNQIQRIDNLKTLEKLDVLDLHSNRIKEIQNVSHLKHLRACGCRYRLTNIRSVGEVEGFFCGVFGGSSRVATS